MPYDEECDDLKQAASIALARALGLGFGPLTSAGAATSDSGPAMSVRPRDLPSVGEVGAVIPAVKGGGRNIHREGEAQRLSADCLAYSSVAARTISSEKASYSGRRHADLFAAGRSAPIVSVFLYPTRTAAAAALDEVRASYRDCLGDHDATAVNVKIGRLRVPAIGRASVGFRAAIAVPDPVTSPRRRSSSSGGAT